MEPDGLTLENDGEVRVFLPFRYRPRSALFKSYDHAQTQRRVGVTPDEFLKTYGVASDADEGKARLFDALGITQEELNEAMQRASKESVEHPYRSLMKLVNACREARASSKLSTAAC
jgi:hypothetical protein